MLYIRKGSATKKIRLEGGSLQPYLLSDYSRVLTKKSIQRLFGQGSKLDWMADFAQSFTRYGIVAPQLLDKIASPVLFRTSKTDDFPTAEEGYTTAVLKEFCGFLLYAKQEGYLSVLELKIAATAQKILEADARSPLDWQIDEITGFNLEKSKTTRFLIDYMAAHTDSGALGWIATFDDTFWESLFRYLKIDWPDIRSNPKATAQFINEMVFRRLDAGLFRQLENTSPKREYRRKKGPQLNQQPGLKQHLDVLRSLLSISGNSPAILEQLAEKAKPLAAGRNAVLFKDLEQPAEELSSFDKQLKKALLLKKEG